MAITKTLQDKKKSKKTKLEILRPRTAYNFFYRYQRDSILKAMTVSLSPEEKKNTLYEAPDPYSWFLASSRKKRPHRKTHGLIGLQQLTKTVAKRWKEADNETKDIFTRLAEQDKIRYRHESNSINASTMQTTKPFSYSNPDKYQQIYPMGPNIHFSDHCRNMRYTPSSRNLDVSQGIHNTRGFVSCNPITYEYEPLDFKKKSDLRHHQTPDNNDCGFINRILSNEECDILHLLLQE